jgi:uncharacterized metal-binding protein
VKHNTEQTVSIIDPEILREVSQNTLMLIFEKVVDIFSICCKVLKVLLDKT